ncbi:MAG: ribonuclease J [Clostridia bacterium]|nr:ribonuclease J [Clostridia bacterium]
MAQKLKIIPLGGLLEIGKNITVIELGSDMIIVDVGVAFPDDDMFGIDLVIPDFSYIVANKKKVKGIFLTHGHEDHIGAVPFLLNEICAPVYATRLTAALVEHKLSEKKPDNPVDLNVVEPGDVVEAGCFSVEFINVNHSIADACALAIKSPFGTIVHTGDFKIDSMPVAGEMIDLTRLGQLGKEGVTLLLSDSTNAERGGMAMSESSVGERFREIFKDSQKRIIVASFASNVHRMQQVMNAAVEANRKIAVSGRSMENILSIGLELGYIDIPHDALIDITDVKNYPRKKVCIITTGSQGEEMSALYRMAFDTHKQVKIGEGDLVILSANPIPGNEKPVYRLVNELFRKGAEVVYERLAEVHVSGHACREELKLMLALTKPRNFMPVHGEYRHLAAHAELGVAMGIPENNVFVSEIGRILEISREGVGKLGGTVPSGKVLVDGLGVGDVGSVVLRDRKHLSQDGIIIVSFALDEVDASIISGPEIVTRGFIYAKDAEELIVRMKEVAIDAVEDCRRAGTPDWMTVRAEIRSQLANFITRQTKRSPMILPILLEVEW